MTHPSDDVLAGLLVGDAVPREVADHAAACPRCGDVLAGLADVGVLLREHGNADFPTPSGAVWAAIEQVTAPDAPVRSLAAARSRRSGMPRGPVGAAAAAAAVLAVAGFGFGRLTAPAVPASAISQPTTTSRPTAAPATPVRRGKSASRLVCSRAKAAVWYAARQKKWPRFMIRSKPLRIP